MTGRRILAAVAAALTFTGCTAFAAGNESVIDTATATATAEIVNPPAPTGNPPATTPATVPQSTDSTTIAPLAAATADPAPLPPPDPINGVCDSWRPLLVKYGLPVDAFLRIMYRESRCSNVHTYRRRTRDDSFGPVQVNRWGSLDAKWSAARLHPRLHVDPGRRDRGGRLLVQHVRARSVDETVSMPARMAAVIVADTATQRPVTVCQIKTWHNGVITTKCGSLVGRRDATAWTADVTCQWCQTGRTRPDDHADYLDSITKGQP